MMLDNQEIKNTCLHRYVPARRGCPELARRSGCSGHAGRLAGRAEGLFSASRGLTIRLLSALLLLCLVLTGCSAQSSASGNADTESTAAGTESTSSAAAHENSADFTVEWDGKTYQYNSSLTNILFIGVDTEDEISVESELGSAGQADCLMLLSLDKTTQEATILQINRNAMTEVYLYDSLGNRGDSVEAQVCLQYAYNSGGSNSCRSVVTTVSELLFGLDIDAYFAMVIAGLPEINDALGGVTVTCSYDYTDLDESYTAGTVVTLKGTAAQAFVQYRDTDVFNSVQERMYRQVDYVTALISNMNSTGGTNLYELLSPYLDTWVLTNLSDEELNEMRGYTYLTDDVLYLPGEEVMGEEYEEFYVDDDALQALLIETYYTEVTD